jgi:hypothetical protein
VRQRTAVMPLGDGPADERFSNQPRNLTVRHAELGRTAVVTELRSAPERTRKYGSQTPVTGLNTP